MKFHSDDIRKYQSKLENFLTEAKEITKDSVESGQVRLNKIRKLIKGMAITEDTGKKGSTSNEDFKQMFKTFANAGATDRSVEEILRNIIRKLNGRSSGTGTTDLVKIVQEMVFLDTINEIFVRFNAQSAGFLVECFLAALFAKGEQIPLSDTNTDRIIDIKVGNQAYGVKAIDGTDVKGSKEELAIYFEIKNQFIKYDAFIKKQYNISEGAQRTIGSHDKSKSYEFQELLSAIDNIGDKKLTYIFIQKSSGATILKFTMFDINKTNLLHFLAKNKGEKYKTKFEWNLGQINSMPTENYFELGEINLSTGNIISNYEKFFYAIEQKILPIYDSLSKFELSLLKYFGAETILKRKQESKEVVKTSVQIPAKTSEAKLSAL